MRPPWLLSLTEDWLSYAPSRQALQKLSPQGAVSGSAITWKQIQQLNSALEKKATKKQLNIIAQHAQQMQKRKKRIEVEEDNHSGVFQGR